MALAAAIAVQSQQRRRRAPGRHRRLGHTVSYHYDSSSPLTGLTDALGRPISRQDPRGTTVYYGYNERGQRTELSVLGQGTVYYRYNEVGRMVSVLDGKTDMETTYEYDPTGRVTVQAHPNGATTYFSYDLSGRLSEKVTKKNADLSVLVQFAYTRDAAGNPTIIERESGLGVFYYEYDQLQRLAYEGQFVDAVRQYENYYEYDLTGNRTLLRHGETDADNVTYYDYNEANELLTAHDVYGWTYFSYDLNGNTVQDQQPSYTRYYEWDGRDMMVGVRSTEAGWTDNGYRYDGMASRVSTLESIGLTYYDWDGINVIQEKDASNAVTDRQVHGYAPVASVGSIALMDKSGMPYFPTADPLGTVWNLADSSAAVANSYTYDAFGVGRSVSEAVSNRYRFGTKRLDVDSGLYHFIARPYEPLSGIFVDRDHLREMNRYVYAKSRPSNAVDPWGLKCKLASGPNLNRVYHDYSFLRYVPNRAPFPLFPAWGASVVVTVQVDYQVPTGGVIEVPIGAAEEGGLGRAGGGEAEGLPIPIPGGPWEWPETKMVGLHPESNIDFWFLRCRVVYVCEATCECSCPAQGKPVTFGITWDPMYNGRRYYQEGKLAAYEGTPDQPVMDNGVPYCKTGSMPLPASWVCGSPESARRMCSRCYSRKRPTS